MARRLVICCDGTGNEIKENQSNVLKFFRVLKKDKAQIAYYDPGVGTLSDGGAWSRLRSEAKGIFGLATGYGLDANILEAYRFLVRNHRPEDTIYLFGFSRGAYTVRVLAGFLHMVGLLEPEQENLCGYALTAYKRASEKDDFSIAWRVNEVLAARRVTIRFMGCWDTVGSVIIPRPDRFYIPSFETLPYTQRNPSVQVFRHALAIDERRRMFRHFTWEEPQLFKTNPFVKDEKATPQDVRQVWFAGYHSDIGGGHPEPESGAAKIPLQWMMDEAGEHGLTFRPEMARRLVLGRNPKNSSRNYVAPDPHGELHDSMRPGWAVIESILGLHHPFNEPRHIPEDADIHPTVRERRTHKSGGRAYRPENLPAPPRD